LPRDRDIDVAEHASPGHETFRCAAFLGRTAVVTDSPRYGVRNQIVLHGSGGQEGRRPQQVVAAAMAEARSWQWLLFGHAGLLRQARQRVVFAQDSDYRTVLAGFAHDGGWDASNLAGHAEAL